MQSPSIAAAVYGDRFNFFFPYRIHSLISALRHWIHWWGAVLHMEWLESGSVGAAVADFGAVMSRNGWSCHLVALSSSAFCRSKRLHVRHCLMGLGECNILYNLCKWPFSSPFVFQPVTMLHMPRDWKRPGLGGCSVTRANEWRWSYQSCPCTYLPRY